MGYMGNSYGNAGLGTQNGISGTSYQPQPQFVPQTANYALKMGIQFASQAEMEALIASVKHAEEVIAIADAKKLVEQQAALTEEEVIGG
jgi:hypothetical protein